VRDGLSVRHQRRRDPQKTEWIGSTIPIVPFWGREATVDGKRRTFSLTRNAQGPQQLLNVYISNLAELIGKMPKSNWKAPVGSIPAGAEKDYANPNNAAAILYYEIQDAEGARFRLLNSSPTSRRSKLW
jgi:hypothetical protein